MPTVNAMPISISFVCIPSVLAVCRFAYRIDVCVSSAVAPSFSPHPIIVFGCLSITGEAVMQQELCCVWSRKWNKNYGDATYRSNAPIDIWSRISCISIFCFLLSCTSIVCAGNLAFVSYCVNRFTNNTMEMVFFSSNIFQTEERVHDRFMTCFFWYSYTYPPFQLIITIHRTSAKEWFQVRHARIHLQNSNTFLLASLESDRIKYAEVVKAKINDEMIWPRRRRWKSEVKTISFDRKMERWRQQEKFHFMCSYLPCKKSRSDTCYTSHVDGDRFRHITTDDDEMAQFYVINMNILTAN